MKIYSNFESGNIQVVSAESRSEITLSIKTDHLTEHKQWFYFRLESTEKAPHHFRLIDLDNASYPEGWPGYNVVASYDRKDWFRIPSHYQDGILRFEITPEQSSLYFAYFAPYSYEQHLNLIHQSQTHPLCTLTTLGTTTDNNDMSLLTIGQHSDEKKNIWIIGRQHPGESMAEWFIDGLLNRLLNPSDTVSRSLLDNAVFHIVPNMNPDGSRRGHLRTNAMGIDLNREWQNPSEKNSPEVFHVRQHMLSTNVDLFFDIHGDESIPYNFVAGNEGIPSYDNRLANLEHTFKKALLTITPEFQDEFGYEKDLPGKANLNVASNWVGEQFKCLAFTVEMPFKDHDMQPNQKYGWSDKRSIQFGKDFLTAIHVTLDKSF